MSRIFPSRPLVTVAALLVALALPAGAEDAGKTIAVPELRTMISGMGLTDTGDKKGYVSVEHQGSRDLTITLRPVEGGTSLALFAGLGAIAAGELAIAPAEKMLEWNDTHRFYFSIGGDAKTGYLRTRIEAAAVSPKTLREGIDQLIEAVDETEDLWDQDNWKRAGWTGAGPGAIGAGQTEGYAALQAAADAAWAAGPLKIRTAVFTKDRVPGFGDYAARETSAFKTGDVMHVYVEPVYYAWRPEADGKVAIDLTADILIKTATGSVALDQKRFLHIASDFPSKIKTVDMVANVTLADGLAATSYVVTMSVHDEVGKTTASVDMPFSIVGP